MVRVGSSEWEVGGTRGGWTSWVSTLLSEEEPTVHSMMPPQPKKSRKTFPKWSPGNASRRFHGDKTYPAKPLLRAAETNLSHHTSSSSSTKERCGTASSSLAGPPHPASAFTPPSTFLTVAMPGMSQREEDRAGPAARGNSGCKVGCWHLALIPNGRVGWAPSRPLLCSRAGCIFF